MKEYRTLDTDQDFTSSAYQNKYGGVYGKYLVGVHSQSKSTSHSNKDNKEWWEWAFKKYQLAPPKQGKFAGITKAIGDDGTSLKKVCSDAYKQEKANGSDNINNEESFQNIVSNEGYETQEQYLESAIWRFCSILGTKPKTLSQNSHETYPNNSHGWSQGDRKMFISVGARENAGFWKHQETLKSSIDSSNDKFFHNRKDKKSIKDICWEAYGKSANNGNDTGSGTETEKLANEINKYCKIAAPTFS